MAGSRFSLRSSILVSLAAFFGGVGCSELERYRECHRLADTINPALVEIERLAQRSQPPSPKNYSQLADRYRQLKVSVKKLALKDENLDPAVDSYVSMLTLAEKQLRQSASAMATNKEQLDDAELLRRHQLAMSAVLAQQQSSQGRLRGLCRP
ncbi:MAG TPA: hypothetical protein VHO25_09795 [Polyangiaceae bacterium]|nr:hypothetical protein [Polyangiaceae bacterium]